MYSAPGNWSALNTSRSSSGKNKSGLNTSAASVRIQTGRLSSARWRLIGRVRSTYVLINHCACPVSYNAASPLQKRRLQIRRLVVLSRVILYPTSTNEPKPPGVLSCQTGFDMRVATIKEEHRRPHAA